MNLPISPEMRQKAMQNAKAEVASRQVPILPTLKLKQASGDAVDGVKEGEFYVTFQETDSDGNKKTVTIPVGHREATGEKNTDGSDITRYVGPELVILKRLYTYSWYSEKADAGKGRLMAWTNEIESFGDLKVDGNKQEVVLVDNPEGAESPTISYRGNYRGFKEIKDANYKDRDGSNLLKFRNVLYVWMDVPGTDKKCFRFFVSNAGVTGVKDGEKTGDYKNPEKLSLLHFIANVQGTEAGVLFGTRCRLGSRQHTGGGTVPYHLPQFHVVGPVADVNPMADLYAQLDMFLDLKFEQDFGQLADGKGNEKQAVTPAGATVEFDDLPDTAQQ